MQEIKEDKQVFGDLAQGLKLFSGYLRRKWWLLLTFAIVGAALGAGYYYFQKPKYEAVCTFILEEKTGGMGGLSGLASQFGFDMGSLTGGGSIFAGDNILDILRSKNIIRKVLLSNMDTANGKKETLADRYLEVKGWKKKWAPENELREINFHNSNDHYALSLKQDSVLNLIYEDILKNCIAPERLNKKGSIIKVTTTAGDQYFAKLFSDRVVEESKTFYITIKTNTSQQNVNRLERKADSLLALLNNKSYEAAAAVVLDANPAMRSLSVPSELKMRDKTVLATLYTEVVKNLEISRISLSQETPVIQILDQPEYPLVDKRKKMLLLTIAFAFGSLLFVVLILGLKFLMTGKK